MPAVLLSQSETTPAGREDADGHDEKPNRGIRSLPPLPPRNGNRGSQGVQNQLAAKSKGAQSAARALTGVSGVRMRAARIFDGMVIGDSKPSVVKRVRRHRCPSAKAIHLVASCALDPSPRRRVVAAVWWWWCRRDLLRHAAGAGVGDRSCPGSPQRRRRFGCYGPIAVVPWWPRQGTPVRLLPPPSSATVPGQLVVHMVHRISEGSRFWRRPRIRATPASRRAWSNECARTLGAGVPKRLRFTDGGGARTLFGFCLACLLQRCMGAPGRRCLDFVPASLISSSPPRFFLYISR